MNLDVGARGVRTEVSGIVVSGLVVGAVIELGAVVMVSSILGNARKYAVRL